MMRLLGGIRFALALILLTTIYVIAGTFFDLSYRNPFFILLLCGFFINILFAALRRWPFRIKHIPFLITHLGLLMILAGSLVKILFGLQGTIGLLEGSAKQELLLSEGMAIQVEESNYPLKQKMQHEALQIELLAYHPHSAEQLVNLRHVTAEELPALYCEGASFRVIRRSDQTILVEKPVEEGMFDKMALVFQGIRLPLETLMQEGPFAIEVTRKPALFLYEDGSLLLFGAQGQIHRAKGTLMMLNRGHGGYLLQAVVPAMKERPKINLEPLLNELRQDEKLATTRKALGALLPLAELNLEELKERGWPAADLLPKEKEALLPALWAQIIEVADRLPEPEEISLEALTLLMKLYEIPVVPEMPPETVTLEIPVSPRHIPLEKVEDSQPMVQLRVREGEKSETITLAYDKQAMGLKWPVLDGKYLLRFQPETIPLPYKVKLRDARQINYPHTAQAASYECDLLLTDTRNGERTPCTLSMNHVYETKEGFRFYLSGLVPGEETSVQRVQLVVSHDPAKYYLTYPGGLLISLGILLLFWKWR